MTLNLTFNQVCFSYGAQTVLDGITFHLEPGRIYGLLGRNGAGKSTCFKLATHLLSATSGSITIGPHRVDHYPGHVGSVVGYLPEEALAYPNLSILENLHVFAKLWGVPAKHAAQRSQELLEQLNLWEARATWASNLSKGMAQKLALILVLLHDPQILILDEPFSGMDLESALHTRDMVTRLAQQGKLILFSSHVPEEMDQLADEVLILTEGRIQATYSREVLATQGGVATVFRKALGSRT